MEMKKFPRSTKLHQQPEAVAADTQVPLAAALDKNQEVQEKIEVAAGDLSAANQEVKEKIAEGATTVPAEKALADGEKVAGKVQEAARDLDEVNETLAKGIEDLREIESALTKARTALVEADASLTSAQEEEKQARLRALHDAKTGLPNRDLFDDRLAHAISLADRHDWNLAILFLDLDRFKNINDTHGHAIGDLVLKEVSKRLLQRSRDEDTVCRNGGDEFLYLLMNPNGNANVHRIASDIATRIAEPIDIGDIKIVIKPSIGIAVYPDHGATGDQLIGNADAAMYRAKELMSCCAISDAHRPAS